MFGKVMNSFYYGKSGKGDFRKEDLPQTRMQLFFETLRVRLSALVRLNLMYVVVWLPFIYVVASAALSFLNGAASIEEMRLQVEAGELAAETYAESSALFSEGVKALILRTLIFIIPCIAITGPCTAGLCYVTRNWARDEHAFIWSDFKDAVKSNWKQALTISAITSILPLIAYVCWAFYGEMTQQNALFVVPQVFSLVVVALWACALIYLYPLMVTYQLRFRELLRNGFLLAIGRLPMTVGLRLLSLMPLAIAVAVGMFYVQWALLGLIVYYLVFGYSLSRFVSASYTNAVFDRYINPNIEGAEVGRGLYQEEDDGEDEASAEKPTDLDA